MVVYSFPVDQSKRAAQRAWTPAKAFSSASVRIIRRAKNKVSGRQLSHSTSAAPAQSVRGTVMFSQSVESSGGVEPSR